MPITKINSEELEAIWADKENPKHRTTIYVVSVNTEDCIVPLDPAAKFDKQDYYKNPGKYQCNFNTKYLPYLSAIFHCIFWSPEYPIYVRNQDLYNLAKDQKLRLLGVCDVLDTLCR